MSDKLEWKVVKHPSNGLVPKFRLCNGQDLMRGPKGGIIVWTSMEAAQAKADKENKQ